MKGSNYHISTLIESYRFPILLTIGLRIGLSAWVGLVWISISRHIDLGFYWKDIAGPYSLIPFHHTLVGRFLVDAWIRFDAAHLLAIAKFGYLSLPPENLMYFPLFPWLTRQLSLVTFGEVTVAGLFLSTISALIALILFYKLVMVITNDSGLARWTIAIWAVFPTSFFLFAPYTDSLFMCFTFGCFLSLRSDKWFLASLLAGLACMTRAQGVILLIPMTYLTVKSIFSRTLTGLGWKIISIAVVFLFWAAFLLWRNVNGEAGLFSSYSNYSELTLADPILAFRQSVTRLFTEGDLRILADLLSVILFGSLFIKMVLTENYRKEFDLILYCFFTYLSFIVWQSDIVSPYQSITRYVLSLFPLFIILANWVKNLPVLGQRIYLSISLMLMLLASALYTLVIFVG